MFRMVSPHQRQRVGQKVSSICQRIGRRGCVTCRKRSSARAAKSWAFSNVVVMVRRRAHVSGSGSRRSASPGSRPNVEGMSWVSGICGSSQCRAESKLGLGRVHDCHEPVPVGFELVLDQHLETERILVSCVEYSE